MKRVVGSPGTWSGMALRLSQCAFAAASTFALDSGFGYSNYSAYAYFRPPTANFIRPQMLLLSSPLCSFLQIHEHHSSSKQKVVASWYPYEQSNRTKIVT